MSWFDEPRTIGGIPLKGSFLMESGPFGHSGASIVACMEAGFDGNYLTYRWNKSLVESLPTGGDTL